MTGFGHGAGGLRVLVAIASYGNKNLPFLQQIIQAYRSFAFDTDVVVFSEAPKDLGDEVQVVVGLPDKNPWSLPFAHKTFMAQNLDRYDLFIYTEDDMDVSEANVQAFLRATTSLESDEIAGFLRYETDEDGTQILTDVHGAFHWKPESVNRRGLHTIAEFTNEHAGFYILTQSQLKRAIASGGFLKAPYEGRFGLPETAATDPYTCCGFRKVVLISSLGDFLIRHMSNLYVKRHGVPLAAFQQQVQTLLEISRGAHPASSLCAPEPKVLQRRFYKSYYEKPKDELLEMVPADAEEILSIGCGWGAAEDALQQRGAKVTALPLDSVIGAEAARRGIDVVYGTLDEGLETLRGRKFRCVLMTNLLHLLPDPGRMLQECARLVRENGVLVIAGPNFRSIPVVVRRALGQSEYRVLGSFAESGINAYGMSAVGRQIKQAGLRVSASRWFNFTPPPNGRNIRKWLGHFMAQDWVIQAQR